MRLPNHLYDEARSFAAYCSGVALASLLVMIPFYSSTEPAQHALVVSAWVGGLAAILVVGNGIAFARQGGYLRAVPQLVGVAAPTLVTLAFGWGAIPMAAWLCVLIAALPLWPSAFLYGYRVSTRLDAAAQASSALRTGWRKNFMGVDPSLASIAKLCDIQPNIDPWWQGTIADRPASFVSRVASFVVEAPPDGVASGLMNGARALIIGALTKQMPDGPYSELLARPITWFAVELPPAAAAVPDFRAVSRRRTDRDIVFTNVTDRSEHFESIDLDRNYSIRVPIGTDRIRAWQVFSVSLIEQLNSNPHLVVAKADDHVIVMRLHGCATGAAVDELHAVTEGIVADLARIR